MIQPYYEEAGITIYHGDCREVLPSLEKPDLVITDPPYGISHKSSHGASWAGTSIRGDEDVSLRDSVLDLFPNIPWACFGISWKRPAPRGTRGVLVWDKGPAHGAGDLNFPWKPSWEEIYISGSGWSGYRDEGVLRFKPVPSWESGPAHNGAGRQHPHEKPIKLLCHLMSKHPGKLICDPFLGSGATIEAAKLYNRRAIGIEIEEKYCEIAANRLRQGVLDLHSPSPSACSAAE